MNQRYAMKALTAVALLVFLFKTASLHADVKMSLDLAANRQSATYLLKGKVTDESKEPLIGATVRLKGSQNGALTDVNGNYQLEVSGSGTITISYVGYLATEIAIKNQTNIDIVLKVDDKTLEEVVVVGYATQKKENLTGAVTSVAAKQLQNRTVTNLSTGLAGIASGVYVRQSSGKPGSDGATISIRGLATLSGSSPLIIVDGIISNLDAVNPNDVENISILKDASTAAIYGTLAGNGVVLITTKKGQKGKNTINYTGLVSATEPMRLPDFLSDYPTYMRLLNEGYTNVGQTAKFSTTTIEAWEKANADPNGVNDNGVPNWLAYPNTDWGKTLYSKRMATTHSLSINGGADKFNYLLSLGYLDNQGTIENTGLKKYQLRVNLESKLANFLTVGTQTFGHLENRQLGDADAAFTYMGATTPGLVPRYEGKYGYPQAPEEYPNANNVLAWLNKFKGKDVRNRLSATVYASVDLLKGLNFTTRFNYTASQIEQNKYVDAHWTETWNFATGQQIGLTSPLTGLTSNYYFWKSYQTTVDNVLTYKKKIGNHDLGILLGHSEVYNNTYNISPTKMGFLDYNLYVFDAVTTPSETSGGETDYGIRSFFGRVNYVFAGKYLLEGNLRRDEVSRFSPQYRIGYFPSFSAGWRVSEEKFMEPTKSWLSDLKLRGSWGRTGNNATGNYTWQSTYGSQLYSFNNIQTPGLGVTSYANNALQWEIMESTNIGFDASFLNRKFNIEFDYYNRNTTNIIARPPMSLTAGTAYAPFINQFAMKANGIEINLGYRERFKDVGIEAGLNILTMNNNVYKYKGALEEGYVTDASGNKTYQSNLGQVAAISGANAIVEGRKVNEYYLYQVYKGTGTYIDADGKVDINGGPKDGMIRTTQDMDWLKAMLAAGYKMLPGNATANNKIYYGDLIYQDLNGDGSYGNSYDRQFTGTSNLPSLTLGFNLNLTYRGFDLGMVWSGAFGFQYYMNGMYNNGGIKHGYPIANLAISDRYYYNDADPNDAKNNVNGRTPRLKAADSQNGLISDYWMYDASYVKLRNVQFGYTLPQKWIEKAYLQKVRIYFSAENPFMITKFPGLDPEIGTGITYPTMKQYAVGLNVTL